MKENLPDQRYIQLAAKWLDGTITPEEQEEYAGWYNSIDPETILEIPSHIAHSREEHREKILQQIKTRQVPVISISKYKFVVKRIAVAATVIVIAGLTFLYRNTKHEESELAIADTHKTSQKNDLNPGTFGAILKSSNGKTIVLDTAQNGELIRVAGKKIIKSGRGIQFTNESGKQAGLEYYTLTTPRARQQELTLPDGTVVWLNAQSSIKFPDVFANTKREVEITGEAYFEVAKDPAKPFFVHVNGSLIEVLGTHFNIMAYENEKALEATLLEGAVKFSNGKGNVQLKPGQQVMLVKAGTIKLNNEVNVDQVVAWKNGMQSFSSADIKTIMRQVERWYDVDVEYKGKTSTRQFSGDIPRSAKLSVLLKLFDVNKIHFEIDPLQKKLIVMP